MQTDPTKDIGSVFGRSWTLLSSNWIIIVPAIIIGIIAGLIAALVTPTYYMDTSGVYPVPVYHSMLGLSLVVGTMIATFVGMLANVVILTMTTGMAAAAWKTGKAMISDGMDALRRPNVLSAMLMLIVVSLVLSLLTLVTLGLAGLISLVVFFFLIYTIAAAVVGGFSGMDALKESFEVAKTSWLTTLIVVVLLGVVAFLATLLAAAFHFVPFIGPIIAAAISGVIVAFFSLVLVGEYNDLRGRAHPAVAAQPPFTAPPAVPPL
ncbi:MAG: hypothetical protein DLM50_06570 [Candidatus Meridianibacter frigidus]|nr:MAG: hypothetical protein DLM50_06570 [Candidatus Eremiobacteraeota bacterium]